MGFRRKLQDAVIAENQSDSNPVSMGEPFTALVRIDLPENFDGTELSFKNANGQVIANSEGNPVVFTVAA